jgi:Protein-tyrosine phosphatase
MKGVVDTRTVVVCAQCKVHWYVDDLAAKCTAPDHDHQRFDLHLHRSVVVLPDGTEVIAVSFDARDPYAREQTPDFGLYLDSQWNPPWPHDHLEWPDFGVPGDSALVVSALRSLLERARYGERVEMGCLGGHGRTGTVLACAAVLCGLPPNDAVAWVRGNYCANAVESGQQEAFVIGFSG